MSPVKVPHVIVWLEATFRISKRLFEPKASDVIVIASCRRVLRNLFVIVSEFHENCPSAHRRHVSTYGAEMCEQHEG